MAEEIRIPPHSEEAEACVLGSILIDKDAIATVAEFLRPEHFYKQANNLIYKAILQLYEERKPIDIVTLKERLKKDKNLTKMGGSSYLTSLVNAVPTAAHVEQYGRMVKDDYTKRELISAASKITESSFDEGQEATAVLDQAEQLVFALSQKHLRQVFMPVKEALAESFDRLDELHKRAGGLRGVPTGFRDIDDTLAGLQASNLIILAARPGIGKTALSLNIAQHVSVKENLPVGFFSLEMSKEELVDRLLVAQADIDAWRLKTGRLDEEDFTKLSEAMGILAEAPLYIDDTPALSVLEMRTKARRLMAEHGLELIIVDYLQLMRSLGRRESRVQEVSEISQGLKNLARELKVPVLAVSQLSRAVEQRGSPRPHLADLRESGCLLGDSLITLANSGERIKIKELVGKIDISILAMDENMKLVPAKVSKVFPSGRKITYKMVLKSGKEISASGNHPFFKVSGWERLDRLKVGDRIATPRALDIETIKEDSINNNRLILLAHLIGDGCYVKRQPLHYTNSSMGLIETVKKVAEKEFSVNPRLVKQENWYHLYLSAKEKLARGRRNPIVKWLDEELNVYGQRSREKQIPSVVFQQSDEKIALFLRHLWATDGSIYIYGGNKKKKVTLYYASGSYSLVRDVSHLLLRLGILSTITPSRKKGYKEIYNVHIQGKTEQMKFLTKIGIFGEKEKKVKKAVEFLRGIEANPNNDVIPKDIWTDIEELRMKRGMTTREFHAKMSWAYSGTQRHNNGLSRKRINRVLRVLKNKKLESLAQSDLFWDEVVSIEKIGVREVYDATVPIHANFIANDIIVHNSIEQDSDVVMFIWREDEEDIESIELEVAKHRNGPLRRMKLRFRGDRIRFYGMETRREVE
ncbi:hypothetical protein AMJ51_01010 [Microgenomates bacterium DG_75]|nr:MAG: hypothetical protein AMJ51_01010 [Microgenomates bacterium DG_75]